ncbi:MAG: nitrogenase molybdenum-iron protein alpha chain, partial [Candidatus Electrothrix sp. EH2]|nr:nitrogenase molybdenum-iron protein alpha chain [Candidatus Electrothrix sp. EH2]
MGAAEKLVQWEPTDIKAELIKKYPPKVARKRAKQIMINEALENGTPEITANVRTIPGIITMRGCTYAGCKGVIMGPTRDIVNLVHGPIGCSFYAWLTRRNQTDPGPRCAALVPMMCVKVWRLTI